VVPTSPRRRFLSKVVLGGGTLAASSPTWGGSAPSPAAVASPIVDKVKRALLAMQRRAWEQGVAAQALLELGDSELVVLLAKDALVNQAADGRLALNGDRAPVTDPASNGEPVLAAHRLTGETAFKIAADRMLSYLLDAAPRTRGGLILHNSDAAWVWVDSFYMAPPFLAIAGRPDEAMRQIVGYRRTLRDPRTGACFHIWDEEKQRFQRKLLWGVGNGWAAAGMTRVLRALPEAMRAERAELAGYLRELIGACLAFQRPDGLFHDVLDDPATFVETNAAQMLAYSIYRGVTGGWLAGSYLERADRMRAAAHAKVDRYGLVQGVCGAPNFDRSGTATEGQAFLLLMEAARRDLRA
jgi:unsaturated rhamnogalacturonyl hydrolase